MRFEDFRAGLTVEPSRVLLSDDLLAILRERVASQYYNQPHVIDVIARAILNSRDIYP
jgi:hypothetical protein